MGHFYARSQLDREAARWQRAVSGGDRISDRGIYRRQDPRISDERLGHGGVVSRDDTGGNTPSYRRHDEYRPRPEISKRFAAEDRQDLDRKSTRLNSSHV